MLILDEPTAYLGNEDSQGVRSLMRSTAHAGAGVIFISHHLDEVIESCDRITVLRDGQMIDVFDVNHVKREDVTTAMLGRSLERFYPEPRDNQRERLMSFSGVAGGTIQDFTLDLHAGEVVGVTGLVGSGFEEVPYLLSGLLDITLLRLKRYFRWPSLSLATEGADARVLMEQFGVRPSDPTRRLGSFSGGNQQKIVMAKWLSTQPTVMLLDEPHPGSRRRGAARHP